MENSPDYYNELSVDDSPTNSLSQLINFNFKGGYNNLFKNQSTDMNETEQDKQTETFNSDEKPVEVSSEVSDEIFDEVFDENPVKSSKEPSNITSDNNIFSNNSPQTGGDTVEAPTTQTVNFNTKNDRAPNPQPAQVQYEFKAFYPKQVPQKPNYVMPSVITPGMNPMVEGNAKYIMPIVNNININGLDPFNSKTNLAPIVEYLLPLSNISEIFNTIKDRQLISDFIKSVLLFNEDGIIVDSLKYNIKKLMNSLKVVKMNPYVSQEMYGKISPFKFPVDFLLYKSCFPIKYIQNTIKCEKNSTHVNLRFYRVPRGDVLDRRNPDVINVSKALSEMKYYNYVKNEIVYKHESPNFVLMYGYNFYNDKDIKFNEGDENTVKKQEDTIEEMDPKLYEQIYNELRYHIYRKYIESNNNAINFVEHDLKIKEEIKNFCKEHQMTIAELTQDTLDQLITKYLIMIDASLRKQAISLINTITLHNKYLNDFILAITESPTYSIYDWASKIYADNIGIRTMINTGYHSHFQWMSIIFQTLTAFHSLFKHKIYIPNFKLGESVYIYNIPNVPTNPKVWKYLVDGVEYFVPNYGDFVMIDSSFKTINMSDTIKTYGKDFVENIYNLYNNTSDEDKKKEYDNEYEQYKNNILTMLISLIECFNISNFKDNVFYSRGGTVPEGKTLELIDKIYTYLNSCKNNFKNIHNIFKNAIHMFMGQFLNNRVGTYLQDEEAREQLREVNIDNTPSGTYIVYLDKSGRYKIGVYVNNDISEDEKQKEEPKKPEEVKKDEAKSDSGAEGTTEEGAEEEAEAEEKAEGDDVEPSTNQSDATIEFVSEDETQKIKQNLNSISIITEKGLTEKVANIVYTLPSDYELTQINTNEMTGDRTASGILDTFNII